MLQRCYMTLEYLKVKAGKIMDKEMYLVMDDTVDIGKEPSRFKSEQEKKIYDELMEKYKKEFNI